MRGVPFRAFLMFFVVLVLSATALGQGTEIFSGQSAKASLDAPGMWHAYRFEGVKNDAMTLKIVASKKTSLTPVVQLFGPTGEIALPKPVNGKFSVKKMTLTETGIHILLVTGERPTIGDYKLKFKLKRAKFPTVQVAVPGVYVFEAPHGARITATIKAEKGSGLEPGVDAVVNIPGGEDALAPASLTEKGSTAKIKKLVLPLFGEHQIVLLGRGGTTGNASVKLKVKPPKPPEKKLGSRAAMHTMVSKIHRTEAGVTRFGHVLAEVVALDTVAAKLRFPAAYFKPDLVLTGSVGNAQTPGVYVYEENFDTEVEMHAAFPDGFYTLLLTRGDGTVSSFPLLLSGGHPSDVTVTDFGSAAVPTITWTGCDGSQFITLDVRDVALDLAVLVTVLPGDARSFGVPAGIITPGKEYQIEVRGYAPEGRQVLTKAKHLY